MGFTDAAIRSVKNNRSLQRKNSYFKSREYRQLIQDPKRYMPRKLSDGALQRISDIQQRNLFKLLFLWITILTISISFMWKLFF